MGIDNNLPIDINKNEDNMNNNTNIVSGNDKYTVEEATEKLRNLVENLKNHGIEINADEMNFPTSYQVIIKIQKGE